MAALGGDMLYKRMKYMLLNVFNIKEGERKEKKNVGMSGTSRPICCYSCPENKYWVIRICECCGKEGHGKESYWYNKAKCFKYGKIKYPSFV